MKLAELMKSTGAYVPESKRSLEIGGICSDSRKVRPGDAFVCIRGTKKDGNDFASEAVARGAAAVVSDAAGWSGAVRVPDVEQFHRKSDEGDENGRRDGYERQNDRGVYASRDFRR